MQGILEEKTFFLGSKGSKLNLTWLNLRRVKPLLAQSKVDDQSLKNRISKSRHWAAVVRGSGFLIPCSVGSRQKPDLTGCPWVDYAFSALICPNGSCVRSILFLKFQDPSPLHETGSWLGPK